MGQEESLVHHKASQLSTQVAQSTCAPPSLRASKAQLGKALNTTTTIRNGNKLYGNEMVPARQEIASAQVKCQTSPRGYGITLWGEGRAEMKAYSKI